jgi:hypothetical protein
MVYQGDDLYQIKAALTALFEKLTGKFLLYTEFIIKDLGITQL